MDFRASGVRSLKLNIFLILKEVKTNLALRSVSQKRLSNCRSLSSVILLYRPIKESLKQRVLFSSTLRLNNKRYFKLPFIGRYSRITELKLRQLLKRFCETDLNVKLVFTQSSIHPSIRKNLQRILCLPSRNTNTINNVLQVDDGSIESNFS